MSAIYTRDTKRNQKSNPQYAEINEHTGNFWHATMCTYCLDHSVLRPASYAVHLNRFRDGTFYLWVYACADCMDEFNGDADYIREPRPLAYPILTGVHIL